MVWGSCIKYEFCENGFQRGGGGGGGVGAGGGGGGGGVVDKEFV